MIEKEQISNTDKLYKYILEDEEVGYLEIRIVDSVIDIMNLFVKETNRKQGIATKLMKELIENEEYSKIMLEVNEHNKEALRLYTKLGFSEISFRERYYGENTAIIMERYK